MQVLTFTGEGILNARLISNDSSYILSTDRWLLGRKTTTLAFSETSLSLTLGVIKWRGEMFEIGGVRKEWDSLKSRTGIFSRYVCTSQRRLITNSLNLAQESGAGQG